MTDLISTLADDLLALINSKPSTPTKAEIVALLRKSQEDNSVVLDGYVSDRVWAWASVPSYYLPQDLFSGIPAARAHRKAAASIRPEGYLVSQEQMEKAICAPYCPTCGAHHGYDTDCGAVACGARRA